MEFGNHQLEPLTHCGIDHRGGKAFYAGNLGGARRRQAWLSQVWSTRSPQSFHKPKCPNCNEGESENPSARKESCCITCGHNILRCPRLSVSVNWGYPHDSIIIQGAMSHASGAEITKLLRRPPVPNFLRRERTELSATEGEATGSVVTNPSVRLRFRTSWSILLTTLGILSQSRSELSGQWRTGDRL